MQSATEVGRGRGASPVRRFVVAAAVLVGVLPFFGVVLAQDAPATEKKLYHRIGGYDTIAGVVDDFLKQLQADPAFARFGQGRGQNSLMRGRQLVVDQICALSGGPCVYIGREMKTTHQGLAITQAEWESAGKKMAAALQKFKVSEPDQKEFAAMIEKLRPDIVEPPKPAESKPATNN
jgi:hemoglobin